MILQDFLIAGYERRIHGTPPPNGTDESDFVAAMQADPALLEAARAKFGEYETVISARSSGGQCGCTTTAVYRDVLASALARM